MDEIELARFVRETFHDDGLLAAEPKAAERLGLPADAEHFLVNVGLPCGRPFSIDFGPVISLPTLSEFLDANGLSAVIDDPAVLPSPVIGNSYGMLYLMDVRQSLSVIRFDPEGGKYRQMFVNSSVSLFGASLAAYRLSIPRQGTDVDPQEREQRLEKELLRIDPPAVDHYWSVVLQEVGFDMS